MTFRISIQSCDSGGACGMAIGLDRPPSFWRDDSGETSNPVGVCRIEGPFALASRLAPQPRVRHYTNSEVVKMMQRFMQDVRQPIVRRGG